MPTLTHTCTSTISHSSTQTHTDTHRHTLTLACHKRGGSTRHEHRLLHDRTALLSAAHTRLIHRVSRQRWENLHHCSTCPARTDGRMEYAPQEFADAPALHPPYPSINTTTTCQHHNHTKQQDVRSAHCDSDTPRTSRATLAASAASTSRYRCSADCQYTTTTASLSAVHLAAPQW